MNKLFLLSISALCCFQLNSQIVQSSCVATQTIIDLYEADAARLAVRHTYAVADPYKDSVGLKPGLKGRYLDALLAVYNATALTVRDTVISLFNVHTNQLPGVTNINIEASPNLIWMQQISQNQSPTTNTLINGLINQYNLNYTYIQNSNFDMVAFYSPIGINLKPLVQKFALEATIDTVYADAIWNDARNITDSLDNNFVGLNYSIGWGTCADTCDLRHTWSFKVYNDCRVEYLGEFGPPIYTALKQLASNDALSVSPNPTSEFINVKNLKGGAWIYLINSAGQTVEKKYMESEGELSVNTLAKGIYNLLVVEGIQIKNHRIIIQ